MSSVVLSGDTSGSVTLTVPSVAGTNTVTVPASTGTMALTTDCFGVGQTWQNVTGSRAVGTTYTNTTGRPIFVAAYGTVTLNGYTTLTIDSVLTSSNGQAAVGGYVTATLSGVVPAGKTYSVNNAVGAMTLSVWSELR